MLTPCKQPTVHSFISVREVLREVLQCILQMVRMAETATSSTCIKCWVQSFKSSPKQHTLYLLYTASSPPQDRRSCLATIQPHT